MRALVWDGQAAVVSDAPDPVISGDQALIRITQAGLCNTDLEIFAGYMGFRGIPGHEFVGQVIDGPAEWRGKRVVGEINVGDGTCDLCLSQSDDGGDRPT
jgi:threonine dehydrogenase-like Zn-dependent dehydrogenase